MTSFSEGSSLPDGKKAASFLFDSSDNSLIASFVRNKLNSVIGDGDTKRRVGDRAERSTIANVVLFCRQHA